MPENFNQLLQYARKTLNPRRLSSFAEAGGVAAAIETDNGSIFTGVCIDTTSSMGFCAEHAAAAAMISAGFNQAIRMVAVNWNGKILPPCGRCREFISQLHYENGECQILVSEEKIVTLKDLLPFNWQLIVADER